jgi:NTE family protein
LVSTGFVLGGGGHLGAAEVGMLHALLRRGVRPDLIVGTSVGAVHGAVVAADPSLASVEKLEAVWGEIARLGVLGRSWFTDATILLRTRTHMRSNRPLRRLLVDLLRVETFEELAVPFQCVAASIERSAEHWFYEGALVDAILASAAVPGILPSVRIGDEHFVDGGIVNSVPLDRAVQLGATQIFVLHVGRLDQPLSAPRRLRDVAMVTFEIARRNRFVRDLAGVPAGVTVHVLPTGDPSPPAYNDLTQLRYRSTRGLDRRIAWALAATDAYLGGLA